MALFRVFLDHPLYLEGNATKFLTEKKTEGLRDTDLFFLKYYSGGQRNN